MPTDNVLRFLRSLALTILNGPRGALEALVQTTLGLNPRSFRRRLDLLASGGDLVLTLDPADPTRRRRLIMLAPERRSTSDGSAPKLPKPISPPKRRSMNVESAPAEKQRRSMGAGSAPETPPCPFPPLESPYSHPPVPPLRSGTCAARKQSHEKPEAALAAVKPVKLPSGKAISPFTVRVDSARATLTLEDTLAIAEFSPRNACRLALLDGLTDAIEQSYIGRWAKATRRTCEMWRTTPRARQAFAKSARYVLDVTRKLKLPLINVITRLLDMAEEPVKFSRFAKYPTPLHLAGPRVEAGLLDWIPPSERGELGPLGIPDDAVVFAEPLFGNEAQFVQGRDHMSVAPYDWAIDDLDNTSIASV